MCVLIRPSSEEKLKNLKYHHTKIVEISTAVEVEYSVTVNDCVSVHWKVEELVVLPTTTIVFVAYPTCCTVVVLRKVLRSVSADLMSECKCTYEADGVTKVVVRTRILDAQSNLAWD